jgi:hypothetical protein
MRVIMFDSRKSYIHADILIGIHVSKEPADACIQRQLNIEVTLDPKIHQNLPYTFRGNPDTARCSSVTKEKGEMLFSQHA